MEARAVWHKIDTFVSDCRQARNEARGQEFGKVILVTPVEKTGPTQLPTAIRYWTRKSIALSADSSLIRKYIVQGAKIDRGLFAMTTQTEQANNAFLSAVRSIPGVIAAKPYGGRTLAEQSIAVVIQAMRSATSRQVFELEGSIFRAYPDARLDVRVIGLKERNLDPSEFASVLPK